VIFRLKTSEGRKMKEERKGQLALVSDFIWRSLANLNMSRDLNDL
jgi:hypothetical protein